MKTFNQKLALITGGSSGIGKSLAVKLASLGANVWILARREELLKSALDEIRKSAASPDQKFGYLVADISDWENVSNELGKFTKEVGTPDLLINNAGFSRPGLFIDQEPEIFRQLMETNYLGAVYVTKCIVPGMIERRSGYITNISSIAGFAGVYGYSAYGATKFALRGFSDVLMFELKQYNIKLSVVFPPDTQTPQLEGDQPYLPDITRQMSEDNAGVMTPEAVAEDIIKGITKEKYVILPGFNTVMLYHANNILDNLSYTVNGWMVDDARRKVARKSGSG